MKIGIKNSITITVETSNTASAMGSGELDVFATPAMVSLAERTCFESVAPYLEDGCGTVGTAVNIVHTSATPMGMKVTCNSILTQIDRRSLHFEVEISDECGLIGKGTHDRFIIDNNKFMEKTSLKTGVNR